MVGTRSRQPPRIAIPNYANLYHLNYDFTDEKVIRSDPFIEAINNYFNEARSMNDDVKKLVAEKIKKKIPNTPKKKVNATNLVIAQIAHFRAIGFDDESTFIEHEPPQPLSTRTSPRKKVLPQKHNCLIQNSMVDSPRPNQFSPSHHVMGIPSRFPHLQNFGTPNNFASSKSKITVPKVSTPKAQDPHLKEKIDFDLKNAEQRRIEYNKEKAEKAKKEREEKEKKVKERQQQMEEETRRQQETIRNKEARQKEFKAKQLEEAKIAPTTPKEDKKKKVILTPRNVHIPPKKGKNLSSQNEMDIASPVLKHKKPTPAKSINVREDEEEAQPLASEIDEIQTEFSEGDEEVKNYVELTFEEAEEEIRKKMSRSRVLSFDNFTSLNSPYSQRKNDKIGHNSDIVEETVQFRTSVLKAPEPKKLFSDILEDTANTIDQNGAEPEPMDIIDENNENIPPSPPPDALNKSCYDMTADKVFLPSTETNYNVDDLSSGDETDDESKPKKTVPNWAKKHELNVGVRKMLKDLTMDERCKFFGIVQQPSTEILFNIEDNRHRNSSFFWQSPLTNPTAGISRLPLRHHR